MPTLSKGKVAVIRIVLVHTNAALGYRLLRIDLRILSILELQTLLRRRYILGHP